MRPRVLHRCVLWLLPLLIARLCVPAGFMMSVTSNGLDVMLCPAYAALPGPAAANAVHVHHAAMDPSAHATQGASAEDGSHQESMQRGLSQSLCPFAVAGGAVLVAAVHAIDHFYSPIGAVSYVHDESAWISRSVLIDRIRGPPFA